MSQSTGNEKWEKLQSTFRDVSVSKPALMNILTLMMQALNMFLIGKMPTYLLTCRHVNCTCLTIILALFSLFILEGDGWNACIATDSLEDKEKL